MTGRGVPDARAPVPALLLAALLVSGGPAAPSRGAAAEAPLLAGGLETTLFELVHPQALPPLPEHRSLGWTQEVVRHDGRRAVVRVRAEVTPLRSRAAWPPDYLPPSARPYLAPARTAGVGDTDPVATLATETARPEDPIWLVAARLLSRVGTRIEEPRGSLRTAPHLPAEVLEQGRATCVGRANLAVALLRHAGIPARTAHGIRTEEAAGSSVRVSPRVLHRWVEVFLPDRGWVPTDPARSLLYLDGSTLLLGLGGETPRRVDQDLAGLRVRVLQREGWIGPVDEGDPALGLEPSSPPLAPGEPTRRWAALRVRTRPFTALHLKGPVGARRTRSDAVGRAVFTGLRAGRYQIRRAAGSVRTLSLAEGQLLHLDLD